MKAICIIGSPNENGSTAYVVDRIIDGMRTAGIDVERYVLGNLAINYCTGCRECEITRKCVQRDDMDRLIDGILASDAVLLASPSYWADVTGQMKVFIDRSLPLCDAKTGQTPVPEGKAGVGVAIRAGQSKGETRHILETFEHYMGHLGIEMVAALTVEGVDCLSDMEKNRQKLEEATHIGSSILPARLSSMKGITDRSNTGTE